MIEYNRDRLFLEVLFDNIISFTHTDIRLRWNYFIPREYCVNDSNPLLSVN